MTMTDPIADMLARLRNANSAYHEDVAMPHSKIKADIAEILKSEGYIAGYDVADAVGKTLTLQLKYGPSREVDRGLAPCLEARTARVRQEHVVAPGSRWAQHRHLVDVERIADGPTGFEGRR